MAKKKNQRGFNYIKCYFFPERIVRRTRLKGLTKSKYNNANNKKRRHYNKIILKAAAVIIERFFIGYMTYHEKCIKKVITEIDEDTNLYELKTLYFGKEKYTGIDYSIIITDKVITTIKYEYYHKRFLHGYVITYDKEEGEHIDFDIYIKNYFVTSHKVKLEDITACEHCGDECLKNQIINFKGIILEVLDILYKKYNFGKLTFYETLLLHNIFHLYIDDKLYYDKSKKIVTLFGCTPPCNKNYLIL